MCPVCRYLSSSISSVRAIYCVGICYSAGSRPGTSRKIVALRSSWFQSQLQRKFSSLIRGSRMFSCVLLRSLSKWFRLCLFSLFLVGAVSLWSRWPGSLLIFFVWVQTLNVLWSSRGSRSVLFSFSMVGVVFMAPTMACNGTFWTLSSLLLLALEVVAQEVVAYSMVGQTAPV